MTVRALTVVAAGDAEPMARERGQATIETVAVLPLVLVALLAAAQGLTAAWAAVEAADAARAGARAALVGGDAEAHGAGGAAGHAAKRRPDRRGRRWPGARAGRRTTGLGRDPRDR